jgi:DNA-binding MarR family transcriptional regulator
VSDSNQLSKPSVNSAISFIDTLSLEKRGRHLNLAEKTVLEGAWNDYTYQEIAERSSFAIDSLQRWAGPRLWKFLTAEIGNGFEVNKKSFRPFMGVFLSPTKEQSLKIIEHPHVLPDKLSVLGGQPPAISQFYGRTPELAMLKQAITEHRCICLVGAPGIGKSALVAKLFEQLRLENNSGHENLIWKSIHHAPPLLETVSEILTMLGISKTDLPTDSQAGVNLFTNYMKMHSLVIVFDAAENILKGNSKIYPYGEYSDYGILFNRIIEEPHQSCLILTSQRPFYDIELLEAKGRSTRTDRLKGLGKDAFQILKSKDLRDEDKWGELIYRYGGNPLALKLAASRIQEFFAGKVRSFLRSTAMWMSDHIILILALQTSKLTTSEFIILKYLAEKLKDTDSILFSKFHDNLKTNQNSNLSSSIIIEGIQELEGRSLIEKSKNEDNELILSIQPLIKAYILSDQFKPDSFPLEKNAS